VFDITNPNSGSVRYIYKRTTPPKLLSGEREKGLINMDRATTRFFIMKFVATIVIVELSHGGPWWFHGSPWKFDSVMTRPNGIPTF